jgi:hypothetical protein
MHVVLSSDLQPRIAVIRVAYDLVDSGRAIALFGCIVECQIDLDRHLGVSQGEMTELVL